MAERLPEALVGEALQAARAISDEDSRAGAGGVGRGAARARAGRRAGRGAAGRAAISNEDSRARALVALAARLPEALVGEALQAARAISDED